MCSFSCAGNHYRRSYYSVAKKLSREIPNAYYPNQYENLLNPEAHYRTTGPEIWEDSEGKVTHFVCGVGTGGTISGTGRYLKEKNPHIRVIGADPSTDTAVCTISGSPTLHPAARIASAPAAATTNGTSFGSTSFARAST